MLVNLGVWGGAGVEELRFSLWVVYSIIRSPFCKVFSWRIRLAAYGARLERVLGSRPRGFKSPILRSSPGLGFRGRGFLTCLLFHTRGIVPSRLAREYLKIFPSKNVES